MAKICEKCGKAIGALDSPMELSKTKMLCYSCSRDILAKLQFLPLSKSKEEFEKAKNKLLSEFNELYDKTVIEGIEKKIENIYYTKTKFGQEEKRKEKEKLLEEIMLTTSYEFSGYKITKYIGVVSGQAVLGTGFMSEFGAAFADLTGSLANRFADKLETVKKAAIERLISTAANEGGNAIIGVDFDYITFQNNMIGVIANGTSVVIEKIQ